MQVLMFSCWTFSGFYFFRRSWSLKDQLWWDLKVLVFFCLGRFWDLYVQACLWVWCVGCPRDHPKPSKLLLEATTGWSVFYWLLLSGNQTWRFRTGTIKALFMDRSNMPFLCPNHHCWWNVVQPPYFCCWSNGVGPFPRLSVINRRSPMRGPEMKSSVFAGNVSGFFNHQDMVSWDLTGFNGISGIFAGKFARWQHNYGTSPLLNRVKHWTKWANYTRAMGNYRTVIFV